MKISSETTDVFKFFREYLTYWLNKTSLSQTQAAERFSITKGQLNEIFHGKKGASLHTMEKICRSIGMNIVDVLIQGREMAGENVGPKKYSNEQITAIEAFKTVVENDDIAAKMITQNVIAYVQQKQDEASTQKPQRTKVILNSA